MVCDKETQNSAVHLAFLKNNLTIILLVLQYGADIYKPNKLDKTPLDLAKPATLQHIKGLVERVKKKCRRMKKIYELVRKARKKKKVIRVKPKPETLLQ